MTEPDPRQGAPIAVFAYPRVGDFVRCHTLVQLLRQRHPDRPIDMVGRAPAIELAPLMTGVRQGIIEPFAPGRLDLGARVALARRLRRGGYRTAYIVSRSWKSALAPLLAGIPERIGWFGEFRLGAINRPRYGDLAIPRMLDRLGALALERGEAWPEEWPAPQLIVPSAALAEMKAQLPGYGTGAPVLALAPGSSDPGKNWPLARFAELARWAVARGWTVWVIGAAHETALVEQVSAQGGPGVYALADASLLRSTYRLAAADVFAGNDSGPFHIAAALGKPSVGIFTFSRPFLSTPINAGARIVVAPYRLARASFSAPQYPDLEAVTAVVDEAMRDARRPHH